MHTELPIARVIVSHNMIRQNVATGIGGGMWLGFAGEKAIRGNELALNSAGDMAGGAFVATVLALNERNTFEGNSAPRHADVLLPGEK